MDPFDTRNYYYDLPPELIASQPLEKRDDSRLMVVNRKTRSFSHQRFSNLSQILPQGAVLVANNSRVFKARLLGERLDTGGRVEFFLLRPTEEDHQWEGLMKAGSRIGPGFRFRVQGQGGVTLEAEVVHRKDSAAGAIFSARFSGDPTDERFGEVPLPPYIVEKRKTEGASGVRTDELEKYNTIFASITGSVAAPTAGRHFTRELIESLKKSGFSWEEITLHVGVGTFKPVTTQDLRHHHMHEEWVRIAPEVAARIRDAKHQGRPIIAVGTTSARALEGRKDLEPGNGPVNLYIYPGSQHSWRWVDGLLTNFHLPESTLLMMVADRIGDLDFTMEVYREAVREAYRFYSYGDAMLILPG